MNAVYLYLASKIFREILGKNSPNRLKIKFSFKKKEDFIYNSFFSKWFDNFF